jgi:hypothetical protein
LRARFNNFYRIASAIFLLAIAAFVAESASWPDKSGVANKLYEYPMLLTAGGVFLIVVASLIEALLNRGDVVDIASSGFFDVRLAKQRIPWPAIRDVRVLTHGFFGRYYVLQIDLDPAWRDRLQLSRRARFQLWSNRPSAASKLQTSFAGLTAPENVLFAALDEFWAAAGNKRPPPATRDSE